MTLNRRHLSHADWRRAVLQARASDAVDLAVNVWEPLGIWCPALLPAALGFLEDVAAYAGQRTIGDLTGVDERRTREALLAFAPVIGDERAAHHYIRNLLTCLRLTVSLTIPERAPKPPQRDAAFSLTPLPARIHRRGRPITDDEVAVLRLTAEHDSMYDIEPGPAALALGLTAMHPPEVAQATLEDRLADHKIAAPGMHGVMPRILQLSVWERRILSEVADRRSAGTRYQPEVPFAYTGSREPGDADSQAAVATLYQTLRRRAGLRAQLLTATSISNYRPDHLIRVHLDLPAALHVSGRSLEGVLHRSGLVLDHSRVRAGRIPLVDHHGFAIAEPLLEEVLLRQRRSRACGS